MSWHQVVRNTVFQDEDEYRADHGIESATKGFLQPGELVAVTKRVDSAEGGRYPSLTRMKFIRRKLPAGEKKEEIGWLTKMGS